MVRNNQPVMVEDVVKVLSYAIGAIGFLSVARHVAPLFAMGFSCLYIIAAVIDYRRIHFVPRWALTAAAISFIVFTFKRMGAENFVLPSIEALSFLLIIKLFEEKGFRDYMQIYMLSVFLLAGAALLSIDMVFLVYLVLLTALCSTALIFLTYYSQDRELALQGGVVLGITSKSLLIPMVAAPMAVLLFIMLPRTSYPMFYFFNIGGNSATAGFTDRVRLGAVSGIQEDTAISFRAGMEKIDEGQLYWRGIVLDVFDGTSWKSSLKAPADFSSLPWVAGKRIEQTIYLEPYENRYLFVLDKPRNISLQRIQRRRDLTFSQSNNITRRVKYSASSVISEISPERSIERDLYLQLPPELSGRGAVKTARKIENLARRLAVKNDAGATVSSMLSFLRKGNYRYTLSNLPLTRHPLEDFLFKYHRGNCEYFASAMAVMLRIDGIPSRLVGGYRGGYYNDMGKYYLVPQKNAHVWVEAYIDNKGWLRVDPTPADNTEVAGKDLFFAARLLFDTFSYYWNASVINYDFESQLSLLTSVRSGIKQLGKPHFNFAHGKESFIRYLMFSFLSAGGLYTVCVLMRKRKSASERILGLFFRKAGKLGYIKMKSEGLEEFVMKISDSVLREKAYLFVKEFERYYFRDEEINAEASRRLKHLIKTI
ncbi:MAG: DUF3488 domain-containing transglutaminase family protein [Nitrospirae bacterium]|nr:DUF3488 domain-containing transglutaminase family protein [Nitrospirota bacterium]